MMKKLSLTVALTLSGFLMPGTASAVCDGCVTAAVTAAATAITTAVQKLEYKLSSDLGDLDAKQQARWNNQQAVDKTKSQANDNLALSKEFIDDTIENAKRTQPTLNGCIERTSGQLSAGVGMAGGGSRSPRVRGILEKSRDASSSSIQVWGGKLTAHNEDPDLCTSLDAARNSKRKTSCSGDGIKANADIKSGALFAAAGTGETVVRNAAGAPLDAAREAPNYSMEPKDQIIARKAIQNIVTGEKPELLTPEVEGTPGGLGYLAMTKTHDARMSTAISALVEIVDRRSQPDALNAVAQEAWTKKQDVFKELFPSRKNNIPTKPSLYEFMNLRVNEPNTKFYQDALKLSNGEDLRRDMIRRSDVGTQVNWMVFQQLERLTAINAAMLAHNLEPVTLEKMKAQFDAAQRGGK